MHTQVDELWINHQGNLTAVIGFEKQFCCWRVNYNPEYRPK